MDAAKVSDNSCLNKILHRIKNNIKSMEGLHFQAIRREETKLAYRFSNEGTARSLWLISWSWQDLEERYLRQHYKSINAKDKKANNNCLRIPSHINDGLRNSEDCGSNVYMPKVVLYLTVVLNNPPMAPLTNGDAALLSNQRSEVPSPPPNSRTSHTPSSLPFSSSSSPKAHPPLWISPLALFFL